LYEQARRTLQEERRKVESLEEVLRESEQELSLAASKSNEALKSQVDELKKELRGSAEQMAKLKSGLVDQVLCFGLQIHMIRMSKIDVAVHKRHELILFDWNILLYTD
jgi:DNA repair exonuclease SbcCD ATPase subunit